MTKFTLTWAPAIAKNGDPVERAMTEFGAVIYKIGGEYFWQQMRMPLTKKDKFRYGL
jgi:hypothetical protein